MREPQVSGHPGALKLARRTLAIVVGTTVLAVGTAMVVLPGPAVMVIPLGLAVLATEFASAHTLLHDPRRRASGGTNRGEW